jgi:four helix bundle protein
MDHEKLHVYQASLQLVELVATIIRAATDIERIIKDQILRSSTSVLLNIAEGAGKRSYADKRRFYEISRGSATETAAALDILRVWGHASEQHVSEGKILLRRIVAMLTKLAESAEAGIREEDASYEISDPRE